MKRLLALALLCAATSASAQPAPPKTAEEHYEASKALYNIEKYDEAIAELKKAYELARDPIYLFNIAQAMRKKADCAGALDYYRKYLRDSPGAQNKTKVEQWMTEMEACAKTQPKVAEATPIVEPKPIVSKPIVSKPIVSKPIVSKPIVSKPIVSKPIGITPVQPEPRPLARPGRGLRTAAIATATTGGVFLLGGTLLALNARNISRDIEARCATACDWKDESKLDAKGRNRATLSKVAFGVGGAAVIGGTVLLMLGHSRVRESPVAIVPTGDGAMVTFGRSY